MQQPIPSTEDRDQIIAKVRRLARLDRLLTRVERVAPFATFAVIMILFFVSNYAAQQLKVARDAAWDARSLNPNVPAPTYERSIWYDIFVNSTYVQAGLPIFVMLLISVVALYQTKRLRKLCEFNDPHSVGALLEARQQSGKVNKSSQEVVDGALVRLIPHMTLEHLARLTSNDIDLLTATIHEDDSELQLAALMTLEKIGGLEHLESIDRLISKLKLNQPPANAITEFEAHERLLTTAERCAEILRGRAEFQRERDTLLRASAVETATALLLPAAIGTVENEATLLRPLPIAAAPEAEVAVPLRVGSHAAH